MFDPQAQVEGRPAQGSSAALKVLDLQPRGRSRGETIRLRFNQAVAAIEDLPPVALVVDRQVRDGSWEHVDGRTAWERPDRLQFEPTMPLPAAHRFRVRLEGNVRDVEGVAWEFETWRPTVSAVESWDRLGPAEPMLFWVDQPTSPRRFREHLKITDGRGRALRVRVRRPNAELLDENAYDAPGRDSSLLAVHPASAWPRGKELRAVVDADFRASSGVLGMGERFVAKMQTRDRFRVLGLRCPERKGQRCPLGPVRVALSNPIYDYDRVRVVPEPDDLEISDASDDDSAHLEIDADFEPGKRYEIVLPRNATDDYEQRITGSRRVAVRFSEVRAPGAASLELSKLSGIFGRVEDARIGILAHRVVEAEIRVAVLDAASGLPYVIDRERKWPKGGRQTTVHRRLESGRKNRFARVPFDLGALAKPGETVLVELTHKTLAPRTTGDAPAPSRGVYRISGLGVFAHSGPARGVVRVTDLATGKPRAGVAVALRRKSKAQALGRTDRHGLIELPGAVDLAEGAAVVASAKADALAVPLERYRWVEHRGWSSHYRPIKGLRYNRPKRLGEKPNPPKPLRRGERGLVAVAVGRGIYMPGDAVHIAGWAGIGTAHGPHNTRRVPAGTTVALVLRDGPREVATGEAVVNKHGRFSKRLTIPVGAGLGYYSVEAKLLEATHAIGFKVAQPRIPTFELNAEPGGQAVKFGAPIRVEGRAQYLSGEAAPMHGFVWTAQCSHGTPHLKPLPDGYSVRTDAEIPSWSTRKEVETRKRSRIEFTVSTEQFDHRAARACAIALSAEDASHQSVGADAHAFVHPGAGYLAVSVSKTDAGKRRRVGVLAVDNDGDRVRAEGLTVALHRIKKAGLVHLRTCTVGSIGREVPGTCRTPRLAEGRYRIKVSAQIAGKPAELEYNFRVFPPRPPPSRPRPVARTKPPKASKKRKRPFEVVAPDEVTAGETVTIEIGGPWTRADGMLTLEQTGLRRSVPFTMRGGKATVPVQALHGAGPRLELTARVSRPAESGDKPRVVSTSAWAVVNDREQLELEVRAPKRARPGSRIKLRLAVRDKKGKPTAARVALWVVDDGLHQLRPAHLPNLEWIFNPDRPQEHTTTDTHNYLLDPFSPWAFHRRALRTPRVRSAKAMVKGGMDLEIRRRFESVPLFVGDVGTGTDGEVDVPLRLPDNLTRFKVTAVASAELSPGAQTGPARFGRGSAEIEVSTPLNVRAALPRVLRPGDEAELAALVTVPASGRIAVTAKAAGRTLELRGPAKRTRRVKKGDVARVAFAVKAIAHGEADVELVASLHPDAEGKVLRGGVVRTVAVKVERTAIERAAVYGSVATDRPVAVPVILPKARRGEIEVAVTSTVLGDLDDAASYLVDYPYGCVEQTASRLVPLIALRGLSARLPKSVPDATESIEETVAHLASMQLPSGSFAYWPGGTEASPFGSAYATWVLLLLEQSGHSVPKRALESAVEALADGAREALPPDAYGRARALVERAFAVRALAEARAVPEGAFDTLWAHRDRLPTFARMLLLQALHRVDAKDRRIATLLESVSAAIEQRPAVAHVVDTTDSAGNWWFSFSSPTRTDAFALQTLLQVAPADARIEKLARGLRERRRAGRWRNTQENAFALLALAAYAGRQEAQRPAHRIEAWIGQRRVVDARVHDFDRTSRGGGVGLATALSEADTKRRTHVVLRRKGEGRAYYRVGVQWSPRKAPARAQGLTLRRVLPKHGLDVGKQAVIEVELASDTPQRFVAVEVPLPAGLEGVDTTLGHGAAARTTADLKRSWVLSHSEIRPDRVLLFFDSLPPGTTKHSIPVIATTPGRYTVPAAVAEAMYEPETRARTTASALEIRP